MKDAQEAILKLSQKHRFFDLNSRINPIEKYSSKGMPGFGEAKQVKGFQVVFDVKRKEAMIEMEKRKKGRFILAKNELDENYLSAESILHHYKQQHTIERGFRFLKDPWFMVDSFFLKSRSRLSVLMVVMTLCLLVYHFAQYKLRITLQKKDQFLPNQKGKPIQNPTMRWVFQIMEGLGVIKVFDVSGKCVRKILTHLNEVRKKILILLLGNNTVETIPGMRL